MSLKLGRFTGVPLDALSFANYHRGVREKLMLGETGGGSNACESETNSINTPSRCRWADGLGMVLRTDPAEPGAGATEQAQAYYDYEVARLDKLTGRYERVMGLGVDDFIDYVFLTALHRRADATEKAELKDYFYDLNDDGNGGNSSDYLEDLPEGGLAIRDGRRAEMAQVMFDYISRLPEFYYFSTVN
jgi:hypothetical protein